MSYDKNISIYSIDDVLATLSRHDDDAAWEFASDLTGLSIDMLCSMTAQEDMRKICPKVRRYTESNLCMAVIDEETGSSITTYLGKEIGNDTLMPLYCAYVDVNNNPGIEKRLQEQEMAEPYLRFGSPVTAGYGFCTYPLYRFNANKLRQSDPEGTDEYEKAYLARFNAWQDGIPLPDYEEA